MPTPIFITDYEPSVFALVVARGSAELMIDPAFLGWRRSLRTISYLKTTRKTLMHKEHLILDLSCILCEKGYDKWEPNGNEKRAEKYLFENESKIVRATLKKTILERFLDEDGMVYADKRVSAEFQFKTEELDNVQFIDKHEIMDKKPLVLVDSSVFYSYVVYAHTKKNPHAGVECTVKEVSAKRRVFSGLRDLIKKVNKDCLKCRLREKKSVEIWMSSHPLPRTVLAPPYHSAMMDIAYKFKGQAYKRARTVVKIYAVVIVCIMSGATNILAVEGIQTQDIIGASERHSARHGINSESPMDEITWKLGRVTSVSKSILEPEEIEREIAERRKRFRSLEYDRSHSLLIPQVGEKTWGEKRTFSKVDIIGEITGFRHRIGTKRDRHCRTKYLENVSSNRLNVPKLGDRRVFLPVGAPLLDYLENVISNSEGWIFPKIEDLQSFQAHRGLSWKMEAEVEVRELICGVSLEQEIEETHRWISGMYQLDQEKFGSRVLWSGISLVNFFFLVLFCSRLCRAVFRTPELRSAELPLEETVFAAQKKLITGL